MVGDVLDRSDQGATRMTEQEIGDFLREAIRDVMGTPLTEEAKLHVHHTLERHLESLIERKLIEPDMKIVIEGDTVHVYRGKTMTTIYTIITDEPLEQWCKPIYEGQSIETIEKTKRSDPAAPNSFTTPIKRRWMATTMGYDDEQRLAWFEVPPIRR